MIELKDFSFRYASGKRNALQNLNLTKTAILSASSETAARENPP